MEVRCYMLQTGVKLILQTSNISKQENWSRVFGHWQFGLNQRHANVLLNSSKACTQMLPYVSKFCLNLLACDLAVSCLRPCNTGHQRSSLRFFVYSITDRIVNCIACFYSISYYGHLKTSDFLVFH